MRIIKKGIHEGLDDVGKEWTREKEDGAEVTGREIRVERNLKLKKK